MIKTLSKIYLSKIGCEGGRSTSIWIMSLNILGFFLEITPEYVSIAACVRMSAHSAMATCLFRTKPSWTYLDLYLNLFGHIWTHLGQFGSTSINLDLFGPIWTHLHPFGPIWTHLDIFEPMQDPSCFLRNPIFEVLLLLHHRKTKTIEISKLEGP